MFRSDLEGLRGVAVLFVVLFHARLLGAVGGFVGVDAFYVLSGFLITGLLLRELVATGRLDLPAFYGRRARRILPAATTAIVVILAAGAFIVAPIDLPALAVDATASGLFAGNMLFAARATDYFGSSAPSPFLHYWSLGVEEQFYLLWPLLLLLGFRAGRIRLFVAVIFVISLAASIALTPTNAPLAFYGLPTRAWQLALGALVALHGPALARIPSFVAALGGWLGLAMLGLAAATLSPAAAYPGCAALLPTLGVAIVIAAGVPPLRAFGRISFSLYLYHWPVLVLASSALGDLSPMARSSLVALSIVIATISWRIVEEPFRRARGLSRAPRRSLLMGATTMSVAIVAAQLVGISGGSSVAASSPVDHDPVPEVMLATAAPSVDPRALAEATSGPPVVATTAPAVPTLLPATRDLSPNEARSDVDGLNERGCGLSLAGTKPPRCELGDTDGRVTVALVGDSHAAQWFPALELIARSHGWRVLPFTKDSCIFLDLRIVSLHLEREYTECATWRENVVSAVRAARPDLVIVSSSRWVHPVNEIDADPERQAVAMARIVRSLGVPVAIVADTPLSAVDVPACLSRKDRTADTCATSRVYALTAHLARDGRAAEMLDATLIDMSEWLCGPSVCPAVVDGTIVYRDDHHLTATMARRLAPMLERGLLTALGS